MKKKFLFIGAHPDDETIIAGTMLQLVRSGWEGYCVCCSEGRNGKPNAYEMTEQGMVEERESEFKKFCDSIGISSVILSSPDKLLEHNQKTVLEILQLLRTWRPDIIFTHHSADYHSEHIAVHTMVLQALEIACRSSMLELGPKLTGTVLLATDGLEPLVNPLITFNISNVQELKQRRVRDAYHDRLGTMIEQDEALNRLRGIRRGYTHAECFSLVAPHSYRLTTAGAEALYEFIKIGSS